MALGEGSSGSGLAAMTRCEAGAALPNRVAHAGEMHDKIGSDSLPDPWNGPAHEEHGHAGSGIDGHDLAFGTGSVSGVLGGELFGSYHRWFLQAVGQGLLPTTGAFNYRYAKSLIDRLDMGGYPVLDEAGAGAVSASLSGETKGQDGSHGCALDDTAATYMFLEPRLFLRWSSLLGFDVSVDIPVDRFQAGLQIAPDWRLRLGLVWCF